MRKTKRLRLVVRGAGAMGRGVFAGRRFGKGELIEACPVIPLTHADEMRLAGTTLDHYLFAWGGGAQGACLVLGLGSLYNHSATPNAGACRVDDKALMEFVALRDIAEGEQILVDYQWEEDEYTFPSGRGTEDLQSPNAEGTSPGQLK